MNHSDITLECKVLIQKALLKMFGCAIQTEEVIFDTPPQRELGDLALGCFAFAKKLHEAPQKIAFILHKELQKNSTPTSLIKTIGVSGPYINIFLNPQDLAKKILFQPDFFKAKKKMRKKIVVEFISPNTNKPLHLGHVRNAALGESVSRLLEAIGYTVIRTNLIYDRGIHICKSMVAYEYQNSKLENQNSKPPTPKSTGKKGDHFVGDYYVLYEKLLKSHPEIEEQARVCLLKWEGNDPQVRALWKKMNTWALQGIHKTYDRFGLTFDRYYFESEMYTKGKDIIEQGITKGVFTQDASGAVIAKLEPYHLPDKVLLRKDGTSLYITQDLYLAVKKMKEFNATKSIYVVANEQDLYFKQLFKILELLGYPWAPNCYHLSYALVLLPEGRMKSREGTTVDADTLLDTLEHLAQKEILQRDKKLPKREVVKRSKKLARGALMYYLVQTSPQSEMVFNAKESISFQGKTGPYLLYTYARFKNILRKNVSEKTKKATSYDWEQEKHLLVLMAEFYPMIEKSISHYNISIFANYLYILSKTATEYYHTTPILTAPSPQRGARLHLVSVLCTLLHKGLQLLTIDTLEHM